MEKKQSLVSNQQHSVVKNASRDLLDPSLENHFPVLTSRVTLNWWAISFIAVFFFAAGHFYSQKQSSQIDLSLMQEQQKKIIELLAEREKASASLPSGEFIEKGQKLAMLKLAGDEFRKIVSAQNGEADKIIREQREVIEHLKDQITKMAEIRPDMNREPASISSTEGYETIPFNTKNSSILWYEQKLEKEGLVKRLEQERDTFISTHDLKYPENKERFAELEKNHKLAIYELEQEQYEVRKEFSKNKYRLKKK